jgi:peptidoglycan/LPS O-acetylase OafA/YrhL
MPRRSPREARLLGLWAAGWLAVLLVAGLLWLGEPSLQWPVLLVPAIWALVAVLRGRRQPDDWDHWDR